MSNVSGIEDNTRPIKFPTSFFKFRSSSARDQKGLGTLNQLTWAVRDSKKFTSMVDDPLYFNNSLESITQRIDVRTIHTALELLQPDISNLRLVEEATIGNNDIWAEAASSIIEQSEVGSTAARILTWQDRIDRSSPIEYRTGEEPRQVVHELTGRHSGVIATSRIIF